MIKKLLVFCIASVAITAIQAQQSGKTNVTKLNDQSSKSNPVNSGPLNLIHLQTTQNSSTKSLPGNQQNGMAYDKDGDLLSVDGYKIKFIKPKHPAGSNLCGTPVPVVQGYPKSGSCPPNVSCDNPINRDANIPGGADPVKFMQLRWTVIRDNAGTPSSNIDMNRVNNLMTELNNDFLGWKIQFCLDTVIFVNNGTYYNFDGGNEEDGMKSTYGANFTNVINIYVVNNITNPNAGGYAYFPYSAYGGYSYRGGVLMARGNSVVGTHTLGHELGHTFGLHHTFHGVDEVGVCTACYEEVGLASGAPSFGDVDGDFCSDTYPHPTNAYNCGNPTDPKNGCDAFQWNNTPVDNHMSYSFCSSQFTSQQAGRMHCMINTYLGNWVNNGAVTCGSLPPVADFSGNPTTWPAPATVNFTNLTAGKTTVTSWAWNFDVGGVGGVTPATSTLENPLQVTYSNTGAYTVRLIATNANGTDTMIKTSYINVAGPVGDCDTLDFQWITPAPSITIYSFGPDDRATGVPCPTLNAFATDSLGLYERFNTPTPGSTKVGGVRLGMGFLNDPNDNMKINVRIYGDNNGAPDIASGPLGGVNGLSPTAAGFPGYQFYAEIWFPFDSAITIPGANFHAGVEIIPGEATDTLILMSSCDHTTPTVCGPQGENDSSNYVNSTNFGLIDYQSLSSIDFDLDIVPALGQFTPDPRITSYAQTVNCDTTTVFLFDSVYYSSITSISFTFADGVTYNDTVDPGILARIYYAAGPDTITISAANSCGKADTNTYIIPYAFMTTPSPDFTKTQTNPVCKDSTVNFTATPTGMLDYTWDFGDGTTTSSGKNNTISHTYTTPGSYYVEMTASDFNYTTADSIFYENFAAGIPGTFTLIDNDGNTPNAGVTQFGFDGTNATAWVSNAGAAMSNSWYTPAGTADDWLITPAIALNANSMLQWEARAVDPTFSDGYEVRISTSTPTVANFLANPALFSIAAENTYFTPRNVDLAAAGYASQTVYIAFRNNSNDMYLLYVDDILVGTADTGCAASMQKWDFAEVVNCSVTPPTASITTSGGTSSCDSLTITFSDNSTNAPTSWLWDFNDGTFSTQQNPPAHTYNAVGTYYVRLMVYNDGGSDTAFVTINVYESPVIDSLTSTNVTCNGGNDGSATVYVSSGTTAYTYQWNTIPVQITQTATGLTVGIYLVTVTDVNGCTDDTTVTITEPAFGISLATDSVDVTCNGGNNGSATVTPSGGTIPYTYQWDAAAGSQTDSTATALSAGIYSATVTDAIGCTAIANVTVNEPTAINLATSASDVNCNGDNDGTATATPSGGTTTYSYLWDATAGSQTDSTATGLSAGTYNVTVTDANSCTATTSVTVNEPAAALSLTTSVSNVNCNAGSDGSATVAASGGTTPYSYLWDAAAGSQTTITATGLLAGTYNVTVTDANSCTATTSVIVNEPAAALSLITSSTDASCNSLSDGSGTASASGGTTSYSYQWDASAGSQITATATGLSAGTYSVTVTDANGCTASNSSTVNEPTVLSLTTSVSGATCNGGTDGSATVTPSGGTTAYSYLWDAAAGSQTDSTATGLAAGTYNVTVTDANSCTSNTSVTINEPVAISLATSSTTTACITSNGTATVTPSNGITPYTYLWDASASSQTDSTATGLAAGAYNVTVTDANGCTATTVVGVSNIGGPGLTTSSLDVSCNGDSNGSATANASGGTTPYTYNWSGGQTTPTATGLIANTYTVTVTDNNTCIAIGTATVNEPAVLSLTTSVIDVTCNGNNDGSASVSVIGGITAYSYQWDAATGSQTTATATGLAAGPYSVTVTDANGCVGSASATVTEPAALGLTSSSNDVTCNGGNDGSAVISVSGGTTTYSYQWDAAAGSQTTATATGLVAGNYVITVTDANSCTINTVVAINEPVGMSLTLSTTDVNCNGNGNGSANVSVSGGTAGYSYQWDASAGLQTDSTATGLSSGTYSVTVTDGNGCATSDSVNVNEPTALSLTVTATDVSCNGSSDGSAIVTASGGTPSYTYAWSGGQTDSTATGLSGGTYSITVTDANGCTAIDSAIVNESGALSTTTTSSDVSCNGSNDGSATVAASGGTTAYSYLWDANAGSQTDANATGLAGGIYVVTVTDANGCTAIDSATVNESAAIAASISATDVNCSGGSDGMACVSPSGGVSPYTFVWSNGQIDSCATSIIAGTYNVTITDNTGCTAQYAVTVSEPANALSVSTSSTDANCGNTDGTATANAAGGTAPYSYVWDDLNAQTDSTATGLASGSYNVTVTDLNGCTTTGNVAVSDVGGPTVSTSSTDVSCNGNSDGTATASASGGTGPYTYDWGTAIPQTDSTATGLAAGSYDVTVTDSNGCQTVSSATVNEPAAISLSSTVDTVTTGNNGAINLTVSGGTSPYSYSWSNGGTTEDLNGLSGGDYTVTVTDANGCISTATITVPDATGIWESWQNSNLNIFPNPNKGTFTISGFVQQKAKVMITIYDVLGKVIYKQTGSVIQSTEIDISKQPSGIYFLKVMQGNAIYTEKIILQ